MFELIRRLAARYQIDVLSFAADDELGSDAARTLEQAGAGHVRLVPRQPDRRSDWLGLRPAAVAEYRDPTMAHAFTPSIA